MAHPGGRPTKLTDELEATFVEALRRSWYIETAADMSGIDRRSVYRWIKTGRQEPDSREAQFCRAVRKVLAEKEAKQLDNIEQHSKVAWQASAWQLERRHPERWGSTSREIQEIKKELASLKKELGGDRQGGQQSPQAAEEAKKPAGREGECDGGGI